MNYFLLAETDFFRLINEAGDCNMETAYTAFATQVIEPYLRHRRDGLHQQRQHAAQTACPAPLQDIRG